MFSDPSGFVRNVKEFLQSYTAHPIYQLSSLIGSILVVLIGVFNWGFLGPIAAVLVIAPAGWFYTQNHPFGLRCNYSAIGEDNGHECTPTDDTYTVVLDMRAGDDVDDYRLDVHTPSGADLDRIDGNITQVDEQRHILYGMVPDNFSGREYTEALYLEKTGSIAPEGELVLIKSQANDYTMEWIRLLPE
ncbi:hypothetical protein PNP85_06685 [Halobacterium salinarum]|uniref:hypothetical protein n=1 Tax=Halobacterium TaxID=2239 RepID=UPI00196575B6|nr:MULTISPECIES: hypothetical protein [Halobacterium]MCF2239402.1 hypothetical protein [Halobacterium salinarum]MDL0139187.1 hypothetical protein [Halobacterium salinarum]QRY22211.1 hypothetical protein JT689_09290 [Halobacterium sp. GSL-19]